MSGIAGILSFAGEPVDAGRVRAMTEAVRHRGPDAGDCWFDGAIGLGQRAMASTPEALSERQPLHDAGQDLCVVLDGRLDNRDELFRALDIDGRDAMADATLLLRAYRAWQEEVPKKLLGDFAFAIWDGRRKTLFCARDILGVRPFCYFHGARRFVFGSELRQILIDPEVSHSLNEGMIGEYLAWSITTTHETLFRDVRRLPPGHSLAIDASGQIRVRRYWDVDFGARIRYPAADDYSRHLLELLAECVDCRLRVRGPLGSHLSGGLDSSTVSLLAAQRMRSRGQAPEAFATYSVVYPELPCDESEQIEATARHAGLRVNLLPNCEIAEAEFAARAAQTRDFPGYPMANSLIGTVGAAARARGCRVVLTGEGGDEFLGGHADQLADLLPGLRGGKLWGEARELGASMSLSMAQVLWRHTLKPWVRRAAESLGSTGRRKPALSWLSPDWVAEIDLLDRIAPPAPPGRGASRAQRAAYCATFSAHNTHFYEMADLCAFGAGVEQRHPMLDRRLVEFAYAIPQELHFGQGRGKSLLRMAMRGLLPASTLAPGSNVDFTTINVRALDRILETSPVSDWPAARAGWVQAGPLESAYRESRAHLLAGRPWAGGPIWNLWMAYGVGLAIEGSRGRSLPI